MGNQIHILGGPNGVGKSTQGNQYSKDNRIPFINPDQIRQQQEKLHSGTPSAIELNYIINLDVELAINEYESCIIESNLHNDEAYRFIRSFINKFQAESYCYFYYVDDVNILIDRVKEREKHQGHFVSEETVIDRYSTSFQNIKENFHVFNEVHFFDASSIIPERVFNTISGEINEINDKIEFTWSNDLIDQISN